MSDNIGGVDISIKVGILTVSDSCHQGKAEDKSGALLKEIISSGKVLKNANVVKYCVVPDEQDDIKSSLVTLCDEDQLDLIFTTGGTGFAPRDVTPESTRAILHKEAPGLMLAMLQGSLKVTPLAMLSRPVCGIRFKTLIINLPGSRKAVQECVSFIQPSLNHAIDLLQSREKSVKSTHAQLQGEATVATASENLSHQKDVWRWEKEQQQQLRTHLSSSQHMPNIEKIHSYSTPVSKSSGFSLSSEVVISPHHMNKPVIQEHTAVVPPSQDQAVDSNLLKQEAEHIRQQEILESTLQRAYALIEGNNERTTPQNENVTDKYHHCDNSSKSQAVLTEQSESLETSQLPVVQIIEIGNEQQSIGIFNSVEQKGNTNILSVTAEDASDSHMKEDLVVVNTEQNAGLVDCLEIHTKHVLQDDQLSEMVDTDVASLSDFAFPEDSQVESQLISQISPTPDILLSQERSIIHKKPRKSNSTKSAALEEQLILPAKMHRKHRNEKCYMVPVGEGIKEFLATHPLVKGLYLNRGKRDIKRNLVTLQRHSKAVDKGSWQRGNLCHERNRLDDQFVPTVEGKTRIGLIQEKRIRDEYVVNWYLWCPGHGNCQRKCGGYGVCLPGCKGMSHKQDRHNCSIMLNMKLFLSDVTHWKVYITGSHVAPDSGIEWKPPLPGKQRLDEDMRDLIVAHADKTNTADIAEMMSKNNGVSKEKSTKKRVSYFVSSMKKRRRERNYNYAKTVQQMQQEKCHSYDERTFEQQKMTQIRLVGPGSEMLPITDKPQSLQPLCAGTNINETNTRIILGENHEVVFVQSDDPGSDLLAFSEMIEANDNVIEVQTTAEQDSCLQQKQCTEKDFQTVHLESSTGMGPRVRLLHTHSTATSRNLETLPQTSQGSGTYTVRCDGSAGLAVQDVNSLNDWGALLLAATQQK